VLCVVVLWLQLVKYGYGGRHITHIVRDEVQDFIQGELLLDVLVLGPQHARNVMYCGDTAQTITRGVGFRWVRHQPCFWCDGNLGSLIRNDSPVNIVP